MVNKDYKKYLAFGVLLVAIIGLVFASGCTGTDETDLENGDETYVPENTDVALQFFSITPKEVVINKGDTVVWTNLEPSKVDHHILSGIAGEDGVGDLFDSGVIEHENSFSFKFEQAGEYNYHSKAYRGMVGKIIVE